MHGPRESIGILIDDIPSKVEIFDEYYYFQVLIDGETMLWIEDQKLSLIEKHSIIDQLIADIRNARIKLLTKKIGYLKSRFILKNDKLIDYQPITVTSALVKKIGKIASIQKIRIQD